MAKRVRDGDGAPRSANFRKRDAESDFPRSRDGIIVDGPFSGICSPGIAKNGGRQRSILFSLKILNQSGSSTDLIPVPTAATSGRRPKTMRENRHDDA